MERLDDVKILKALDFSFLNTVHTYPYKNRYILIVHEDQFIYNHLAETMCGDVIYMDGEVSYGNQDS